MGRFIPALIFLPCMVWHYMCPPPPEPKLAIIETFIIFAALTVIQELLRPKPKLENARPAGLGDFQFPTATEGRAIPIVFGRAKLSAPNVTWYGDLQQDAITVKQKTGMFSSERQIVGWKYNVGMQLTLCRGEITSVRGVWVGDKKVFTGNSITTIDIDEPELFGGDKLGSGGIRATLDIFPGTDGQPVSDYLALHQDVGAGTHRTPRYVGNSFLVFRQLLVAPGSARGGYIGNSLSIQPIAVEVDRYPALFAGQSAGHHIIGVDANPINVLYEVLTNTEWGFGEPAADIDTVNFKAASDVIRSELNGFSMVLDREIRAEDFIREIERQIGGLLFISPSTGKWTIKLMRSDYSIGSVPQISPSDVLEVIEYAQGTWQDTTNQITVEFNDRDNEYKKSFALAQDMANALMQGGGTVATFEAVSAPTKYPGCMEANLANDLAWRDLRTNSYPLKHGAIAVTRKFWDSTIGQVHALTYPELELSQLPIRITKVDYGNQTDGRIVLTWVEDIFQYIGGSFGAPPPTGWTPPALSLVAYPSAQQKAFEAPRAILQRDPDFSGNYSIAKVLASARRQAGEAAFQISQRNSSGVPSGSFAEAGTVFQFALIGQLQSNLANGTAIPTTSITLVPTTDSTTALVAAFGETRTLQDLGVDLSHLIMIGDEFMLVRTAQTTGLNCELLDVYRGAMDSVQQAHSAGALVWLVFVGAGITDTTFPHTNNVDIQLRAQGPDSVFAGSVTTIALTMDKRAIRPYPPASITFNASGIYGTPSLEGAGSGLGGFRIDTTWRRKDYRTVDELASLLADDSGVDSSTEYQLEVRADPLGANTLVGSVSAWTTGAGPIATSRAAILTAAAAGTLLRFTLRTRHDIGTEADLRSRADIVYDVTPSSVLTGLFYLGGGVGAGVSMTTFLATSTGTWTIDIGSAYSTSNIEVEVNGGGFVTVIAAGLTSGTFSANAGQTIIVRNTVSESPQPQYVQLRDPGLAIAAYGTFA